MRIERVYERPNFLRMIWGSSVTIDDMGIAFDQITGVLDTSDEPIVVMVIMDSKAQIPFNTTILEALPVYKHHNLDSWLVVGGNQVARMVEKTLSYITKRQNVYWFDTEEEAIARFDGG